jgi:hypothetical protein
MGGGDGTVIVKNAVKAALSDPTVHGNLAPKMQAKIDPVLAKDVADWSTADCTAAGHAITFMLGN